MVCRRLSPRARSTAVILSVLVTWWRFGFVSLHACRDVSVFLRTTEARAVLSSPLKGSTKEILCAFVIYNKAGLLMSIRNPAE